MPRRVLLAAIAIAVCTGATAPAVSNSYESRRLTRALSIRGLVETSEPQDRKIEFIEIIRHDVFAPDEPYPILLNQIRWRTDEDIVERELLFSEGETYEIEAVAETERNLRDLGIFSLASVVPVVRATDGSRPDAPLGVAVFTRDLWSLRFENAFVFGGGQFESLLLQLTERNLFGRGKRATLRFQLRPFTSSVGQTYADRRLFGSSLHLAEAFDVIFERSSGRAEGFGAEVRFGRPLYNLRQRWGWSLEGAADRRVVRNGAGGVVRSYRPEGAEDDVVFAQVYDRRYDSVDASGFHQWGTGYKQVLLAGGRFRRLESNPNADTGSFPDTPDYRAAFRRDVMPADRTDVFPYVQYSVFEPRYITYEDLASYGQSEDVRLGPSVAVYVGLPREAIGSGDDAIVASGRIDYVAAPFGSGLIDLRLFGSGRYLDHQLVDGLVTARIRGASPRIGGGRFVARTDWAVRHRDTTNSEVAIGGTNGLRGFAPGAIAGLGADRFRGNLEYRTKALFWRSFHAGGVLFYDAGFVEPSNDEGLHHSVGFGLRWLFPQFNRTVYRADFGVPLEGKGIAILFSVGGLSDAFSSGSAQAVPLTPLEDNLLGG